MEQFEAFRQKKATEKHNRMKRIQKRLQEIRDKSAAVARNNSTRYSGAVQRPVATFPGRLLRDSTNCVAGSSVKAAERQLSLRAKSVARSLKSAGSEAETAAGRRHTITLSTASETNGVEPGLMSSGDVKNSQEPTADENVPRRDDVPSDVNFSRERNRKSALGKR